jgi:transcriptional regulator with XRE-family HTH domain
MEQTKRKRLEAAGWQAGSAADFVGLTYEESAYVELRIRLSDALRTRRIASRMSQKAAAAAIASSQSRIAKMEAADPTVSLDLLIRGLIALGVSLAELGRIMGFDECAPVTVMTSALLGGTILPGDACIPAYATENATVGNRIEHGK